VVDDAEAADEEQSDGEGRSCSGLT
jgi:hypothetical protein